MALKLAQTDSSERLNHLGLAGVNDARADDHAAWLKGGGHVGGQNDQDAGDQVGGDQVELRHGRGERALVRCRSTEVAGEPVAHCVASAQATLGGAYRGGDPVAGDILGGDTHGDGVIVERDDWVCPQLGGGDGENAGAGAKVEDALAGLHVAFEQAQTELRGRVQPRAEGHTGVKVEDHIIGTGLVLKPRGHNHRALADPHDVVVLLPSVRPILLLKRTHLKRTNGAHLSKVPERLLDALARIFGLLVERQVGA